jgi:RNA polymerase sigma-70 factor (ECF subfamily)
MRPLPAAESSGDDHQGGTACAGTANRMSRLDVFNEHRSLLFGLAYRMSGSRSDAEDIVQEAFIRWQSAPVDEVSSPKAYLSTIVTRLAIDHLRTAKVQREEYVGPWLPEPVLTTAIRDPLTMSALAESLSLAFLVVLENLSETERAAFLLHEVFEYDYSDIAKMIGKNEAACRQFGPSRKRARGDETGPL